MFHSFFDSESPFFRFLGRVLDIVVLSVLWLICSLPIVTIGPASAALYYSCAKCLRHQEPGPYRNFFSAFRQNLKTGIGATMVLLLLAVLLGAGYRFLAGVVGSASPVWGAMRVMYLVLMVIPVSVSACAFPLLSRFTYTVGELLSNSLRMTFRHLPRMVAAGALTATAVALTVLFWYCGVILLTPALSALLTTFLLEPVFRKYTPEMELDEGMEPPWYLR